MIVKDITRSVSRCCNDDKDGGEEQYNEVSGPVTETMSCMQSLSSFQVVQAFINSIPEVIDVFTVLLHVQEY